MSTSRVVLAALAVGIVGCFNQDPDSPTSSPQAVPAKISGLPVVITVEQRSTKKTLTEDQKIERLIATVESLDRAVFVRNGREHTAKDAADHIRRKLTSAREQIGSASEFIDLIASKSSLTGDEYQIRMPDGQTLSARDYLLQELAKLQTSR